MAAPAATQREVTIAPCVRSQIGQRDRAWLIVHCRYRQEGDTLTTPQPSDAPTVTDDGIVLDITDATLAREARFPGLLTRGPAGDLVIDLRDRVVGTQPKPPRQVFDLRDPQVASALAAQCPPATGRPAELEPGQRVVHITGGDRWMDAEAFVYEAYVAIGYTKASSTRQVEELARFADNSHFHAVIDDKEDIIGTMRTIFGPYDDLPVGSFDRYDFDDVNPVCEFSSLVVSPHKRSTGVVEHLYRSGWLDAWRQSTTAVVALIDDWLFDTFRAQYHMPFRQIGAGRHYMGTDPIPVSMPLNDQIYNDVARTNPGFWGWLLEAFDVDEVVRWNLPVSVMHEHDAERYLSSATVGQLGL